MLWNIFFTTTQTDKLQAVDLYLINVVIHLPYMYYVTVDKLPKPIKSIRKVQSGVVTVERTCSLVTVSVLWPGCGLNTVCLLHLYSQFQLKKLQD